MSAGRGKQAPGEEGARRTPTWTPPRRLDLRVADADRRAVADVLAEHYAEGRLDAAEHQERVAQAMVARTGADLVPLLADLPPLSPEAEPRAPRRPRRLMPVLLAAFAALLVAGWTVAWVHVHVGLLVLALVALLFVRRRRRRRRCLL